MAQEGQRDFVKYTFYKVAPEWRRLPSGERQRSKNEFADVLAEFTDPLAISSYSLVGTRGDVDFMLWQVSPTMQGVNRLAAQLNRTELGKFLETPYSYLAMTKRSPYVDDHHHEGQEGTSTTMRIVGRQYLFLYPFVKTHEWYQLSQQDRQQMMEEHFRIGHKYPQIKISTSYSFGLDDQEFVLGFETDDPAGFLDLVMELRATQARAFTLLDTPIFTCLMKPLKACLEDLG